MARSLVIAHVTETMIEAFVKGDLIDAQNLDAFLSSLEEMTNDEYAELEQDALDTASISDS